MGMVKLAIVGTTTSLKADQRAAALHLITATLEGYEDVVLISGGAIGIDTLAEQQAIGLGIPVKIFRPNFNRWEPDGYKERNMLIAQECDILIRIAARGSRTYGSGWTADYAEGILKPVLRYWI